MGAYKEFPKKSLKIRHRLNRRRSSEEGVALIMALLALLIITALAAAMLCMSNAETAISSNFKDEQTAYFAARAALEEIRDRLRPGATNSLSASLPTGMPGTTNGVLYITNPKGAETVTPWTPSGANQGGNNNGNFGNGSYGYPDSQICSEVGCTSGIPTGAGNPWYVSASASTSYSGSQFYWKWVRVNVTPNKLGTNVLASVDGTNNGDRVCWNGLHEVIVAAGQTCKQVNSSYMPVFTITSLAVTPSGSRRVLQYQVTSSAFPPLPGAMIFDGAGPTYGAPNSNAFGVSGNDANQGPNAGAGCGTAANQPAIGGYDAASVTSLSSSIPRPGSYTGTGGSPSVQNVSSSLGPLSTVDGLTQLVNQVTGAALPANVYTGTTSSITNPGTTGAPVVNVVQGDLTLGGGFSGTGILLVTGTLTMSGNPNFNGVILVIGKGVFNKSGGGNGTLNGSILVANLNDSSNQPIALGASNPPGSPTINWNGGGNATIQYDSCWINAVTTAFPYRVLATHEVMF